MSLDWGSFFGELGQGLGRYGSYKAQEQTDAEEREFRNRTLEMQRTGQEAEARYRTDQLAATERQRLQDAAQHRSDQLAKAGVIAPESYTRNAMAAEMPETPGYDAGGMAINAVRNAGQARTKEFESAAPGAVNAMYKGRELMHPIQGGGYAFMDPGTLSNLDVARSNADVAAANRKSAHEIALIRASAAGRNRADPVEMKRIQFMQKGMSDRMKPPVDPVTGLPSGKAMGQAQAYRETRAAWEMVKNNLEVPTGNAKGAPAMPSDSFATHQDTSFDPMSVADEVKGLDPDTAREILDANGYTAEEIDQVLGVQ